MSVLPFVAPTIMALLGILHLIYTVYDFGAKPRYFNPQHKLLLNEMRQARTALAPSGRDYWSGVLGFHLSHSLGLLQFALLINLATIHQLMWLKSVLVIFGIFYVAISHRCWFRTPTIGVGLATLLMIIGWTL